MPRYSFLLLVVLLVASGLCLTAHLYFGATAGLLAVICLLADQWCSSRRAKPK